MAHDPKKRIEQLKTEIRKHDYLYYVHNRPQITDSQYDRLFAELKALEHDNPQLITPDSPTQRVSEQPVEGFKNVRHAIPMLSMTTPITVTNCASLTNASKRVLMAKITTMLSN